MNYFNTTNFHIVSVRMLVRSMWYEVIWNYTYIAKSTVMISLIFMDPCIVV
jgi:hypothetical protein